MTSQVWRDNRITPLELSGIVVALILATGTVTMPMFTGLVAGHDGWMASLLGAVPGMLTLGIIAYLDRRFPGETMADYSRRLLGPTLAQLVLLLYAFYFFHITALVVRQSTDFLRTGFYPTARPLTLGTPLLALTTFMVWHGLEVIGRTTLIVVPIQVLFSVIVTGAAISQLQPELILPLFEQGVTPVLRASLIPAAWFGEVIALAFFFSQVRGDRERLTGAVRGTILVAVLLVVLGLSSGMLFGDQVGRLTYPHASAARFVTIGGFLRIDPLTMAVWLFLTVIKAAILQYVGAITLTRFLGLQDHRHLTIPMAGLILVTSEGLFANKQEVDAWLLSGWPVYAFCFQWLLPGLLALVAAVRFRGLAARPPRGDGGFSGGRRAGPSRPQGPEPAGGERR